MNNDVLVTVMCPFRAGEDIPAIETVGGHGARVKTADSETLILVDKTGVGIEDGGCESDAEIAVVRRDDSGSIKRAYAIGGSSVTVDGAAVAIVAIDADEIHHS
jgi:hypothetical protein